MTRKEREALKPKARGATPRQMAAKKGRMLGSLFPASSLDIFKKVRWKPVAAAVIATMLIALVTLFGRDLVEELDQEIVSIEVRGRLEYLAPGALKVQLNRFLGEGFFSLDLVAVKREIEAMPWVYSASLQRLWPGTLMVYIKEQHPVAIWNEDFYLNADGDPFRPDRPKAIIGLPELTGPSGRSGEVLQRYRLYRERLKGGDVVLTSLSQEARGAWQLKLRNGIVLKLGKDPAEEKLERFIKVFRRGLQGRMEEIESIDARYTNGVAVRWKKIENGRVKESDSI